MNQAAQSNVDVTIGATGYNPYRNSQLASTDLWVKAGMPADLAENYLGAINGALNNLNMASDMKIPGAQKYTGVVLDTELAAILPAKSRWMKPEEHRSGLEEVTEDFGRDAQIKAQALAGHWR
jgi:multiple sugar transport system substrate-binding protein